VTVAEPPFQPEGNECQECHGDGTEGLWGAGRVCQHCEGSGKCDCPECQRERGK